MPIPPAAALARRFHLRWLALPPLLLLWLGAARRMINPVANDFGSTSRLTEPLREHVLHPLHTLHALALSAAVAAWLLAAKKSD